MILKFLDITNAWDIRFLVDIIKVIEVCFWDYVEAKQGQNA